MKDEHEIRRPVEMRALRITTGTTVLGAAYCAYLRAEPFPPDIVRIVPFAWFGTSVIGCVMSSRALAGARRGWVAWGSLLLSIPNLFLAAVFSMAALMGD